MVRWLVTPPYIMFQTLVVLKDMFTLIIGIKLRLKHWFIFLYSLPLVQIPHFIKAFEPSSAGPILLFRLLCYKVFCLFALLFFHTSALLFASFWALERDALPEVSHSKPNRKRECCHCTKRTFYIKKRLKKVLQELLEDVMNIKSWLVTRRSCL